MSTEETQQNVAGGEELAKPIKLNFHLNNKLLLPVDVIVFPFLFVNKRIDVPYRQLV